MRMQFIDCSNPDVIGLFTLSIVCVRLRQNNVLLDRSVNVCQRNQYCPIVGVVHKLLTFYINKC